MAAFPPFPSLCLTFLLCFFCLSSTSAKTCKKKDTCSCEMDDGSGTISLHDIDNKDGTFRFTKIPDTVSPKYSFDWNPCTPLKAAGPCTGNNACQHVPDPYPVGKPDTTFSINYNGDVVILYGKVTYQDYTRQLNVTLKCDTAVAEGSFGDGIGETGGTQSSTYTGIFRSKFCCPSSGLSVGSILLIIFFPLVVMYFVIGIVVNKFARHIEGPDVIPNRSFWSDLPFLVKDGCVFSFGKLKGCCSALCSKVKGDDSYTKI